VQLPELSQLLDRSNIHSTWLPLKVFAVLPSGV
jgi:hypothetical protein